MILSIRFLNDFQKLSIASKELEDLRNQFNDYSKFKITEAGLNYPKVLPKNALPEYEGEDSKDLSYFNFRKRIHNHK